MRRTPAVLVWVAGLCVAIGCRERPRPEWATAALGAPAHPIIGGDTTPMSHDTTLEPGVLATVQSAPVKGWRGPGNQPFEVALRSAEREGGHSRTFGTITLPIVLRTRTRTLNQYPCTSCHLGRRVIMQNRRIADAHNNIQPVHPAQTGAVCSTCHSPDNVELLVLRGGGIATLDESYRLCGQCHFTQADAWAGGGHGKRLDGWEGRRVVMACPDCHDPHRPGVEPRIPFRAPEIERPRGGQP